MEKMFYTFKRECSWPWHMERWILEQAAGPKVGAGGEWRGSSTIIHNYS